MIEGKTASGFAFSMEESVIDNMELVDALAEATDDNPLAVSSVCVLLLGKAQRKRLYDHLRQADGRVPVEQVSKELIEIFTAFKQPGKN